MVAFLAFLSSPLGKLAGYGLLVLVLVGTALGAKHEWDLGQAARKQVVAIEHVSKVQTAAVVKVDSAAAKTDAAAQTRIVTRYVTLTKEIPAHVPPSSPCVPWGVVRLHDAAVLGVDPSTLQAPAGQPDDACSDVSPSAFVATVTDNYRAGQQNAQQLDDLEADIAGRAQAVAPAVVAPSAEAVTPY